MPNLTRKQTAMLAAMTDTPRQAAREVERGLWRVYDDGHLYSASTADALVDAGYAERDTYGGVIYLTWNGRAYLATLAEDTAERMADVAALAETLAGHDVGPLADRLADAVRDAATWMAANLTDGQRATVTPTLGMTGAELQRRLADLAREVRR